MLKFKLGSDFSEFKRPNSAEVCSQARVDANGGDGGGRRKVRCGGRPNGVAPSAQRIDGRHCKSPTDERLADTGTLPTHSISSSHCLICGLLFSSTKKKCKCHKSCNLNGAITNLYRNLSSSTRPLLFVPHQLGDRFLRQFSISEVVELRVSLTLIIHFRSHSEGRQRLLGGMPLRRARPPPLTRRPAIPLPLLSWPGIRQ